MIDPIRRVVGVHRLRSRQRQADTRLPVGVPRPDPKMLEQAQLLCDELDLLHSAITSTWRKRGTPRYLAYTMAIDKAQNGNYRKLVPDATRQAQKLRNKLAELGLTYKAWAGR